MEVGRTCLVLDEKLDTLNGSGSGLGDGGGDTTHCCMPLVHVLFRVQSSNPSSYQRKRWGIRHRNKSIANGTWPSDQGVERTQKVDDEARHAHEGLLALVDILQHTSVSSVSWPRDGIAPDLLRARVSMRTLVAVPTGADMTAVLKGLSGDWRK